MRVGISDHDVTEELSKVRRDKSRSIIWKSWKERAVVS
jgi:hypothetical protein